MRHPALALLLATLASCTDGGDITLPGMDADRDGDGTLDALDCAPDDAALNSLDGDGDGYSTCDGDCDDLDAATSLADLDGDGSTTCGGDCDDQDTGLEGRDDDGDGFTTCDGDCDDTNGDVAPKLAEACDGIDNDCDGTINDEDTDADLDGVGSCDGDCNDADATVHSGAIELCDGLDNDCDGQATVGGVSETDSDADTFRACEECDDTRDDVAPGLPEVCDGIDNNCNGTSADELADVDADGWDACAGDCDDDDPLRNPGMVERCNGEDDDCSGAADMNGVPEVDADGDGALVCLDCDDTDDTRYPDAPELCNGLDDDCDGTETDEDVDGDGDGLGACAGDCDDTDASNAPGLPELCDGADNDCNALADAIGGEGDADSDLALACADCDDNNPSRTPGAAESCDGIDNDCDAATNAGGLPELDADSDSFLACADCDDADAATNPSATETCDGTDENCNGLLDGPGEDIDADGDGSATCVDCDDANAANEPGGVEQCDGSDNDCNGTADFSGGEGDGDADGSLACADCDDADPARYPGAVELCDSIDNDCDGSADDVPPFFVKGQGGGELSRWSWNGAGFDAAVAHNPPGFGTVYTGAVADFDNNGAFDFITARYQSSNSNQGVHLYSGSCAGGFTEQALGGLSLPGSADLYGGGDVDNDGDIDLIGWDWSDGEGWTWLNGGDAVSWTRVPASSGDTRPFYLSMWDGDDLDEREHVQLPLVDIDFDGTLDIVECSNEASAPTDCEIHHGNGDGTFDSAWDDFSVNAIVNGFAIADFDGDGLLELIGGFDDDGDPGQGWRWEFDGASSAWPSGGGTETIDVTPDGGSTSDQPGYGWPYAFDWNGDGASDLIVTHMEPFSTGTRSIEIWLNDGAGDFSFLEQHSATHAWGTNDAFVFDVVGVPILP